MECTALVHVASSFRGLLHFFQFVVLICVQQASSLRGFLHSFQSYGALICVRQRCCVAQQQRLSMSLRKPGENLDL